MWRVMHRLFGWDYVHLENGTASIIRRVEHTASGEPYVRYFGHHLVFLQRPGNWLITVLTK